MAFIEESDELEQAQAHSQAVKEGKVKSYVGEKMTASDLYAQETYDAINKYEQLYDSKYTQPRILDEDFKAKKELEDIANTEGLAKALVNPNYQEPLPDVSNVAPWQVGDVDVANLSEWDRFQYLHPDFDIRSDTEEFRLNYDSNREEDKQGMQQFYDYFRGKQVDSYRRKQGLLLRTWATLSQNEQQGKKGQSIKDAFKRNTDKMLENQKKIDEAYQPQATTYENSVARYSDRVTKLHDGIEALDNTLNDFGEEVERLSDEYPENKDVYAGLYKNYFKFVQDEKHKLNKNIEQEHQMNKDLFRIPDAKLKQLEMQGDMDTLKAAVLDIPPETMNNTIRFFTDIAQGVGAVDEDVRPFQFMTTATQEQKEEMVYGLINTIGQFMIPYAGMTKLSVISKMPPGLRDITAGAIADATLKPEEGGIIHAINTLWGDPDVQDEIIDYLDVTPGEESVAKERLLQRLEQSVEGGILAKTIWASIGLYEAIKHTDGLADVFKLAMHNNRMNFRSMNVQHTGMDKFVKKVSGIDLFATRVKRFNKVADTMDYFGKSPKDIWVATNMVKAPDGKWVFDIDYSNTDWAIKKGANQKVGNVVKNDSMFSLFKEAKDTNLDVQLIKGEPYAYYDDMTDTIVVKTNSVDSDTTKGLIAHELTHKIQMLQNRPAGGSPFMFTGELAKTRSKHMDNIAKLVRGKKYTEYLNRKEQGLEIPAIMQEHANKIQEQIEEIEHLMTKDGVLRDSDIYDTAITKYFNLSGEYEANMVMDRINMPFDVRRSIMPTYKEGLNTNYKNPKNISFAQIATFLQDSWRELDKLGLDFETMPRDWAETLKLLSQGNENAYIQAKALINQNFFRGNKITIRKGDTAEGLTHIIDKHYKPSRKYAGQNVTSFDNPLDVLAIAQIVNNPKNPPKILTDRTGFSTLNWDIKDGNGNVTHTLVVDVKSAKNLKGKELNKEEAVLVTFYPRPGYENVSVNKLLHERGVAHNKAITRQYSVKQAEAFIQSIETLPKKQKVSLIGRQIGKTTDPVERNKLIEYKRELDKKQTVAVKVQEEIASEAWNKNVYSKLYNWYNTIPGGTEFKTWEEVQESLINYGVNAKEVYASHFDLEMKKSIDGGFSINRNTIGTALRKRPDQLNVKRIGQEEVEAKEFVYGEIEYHATDNDNYIHVGENDFGFDTTIDIDYDSGLYRFHDAEPDDVHEFDEILGKWYDDFYDGRYDDDIEEIVNESGETKYHVAQDVGSRYSEEFGYDSYEDAVFELATNDGSIYEDFDHALLYTGPDGTTYFNRDDAITDAENYLTDLINDNNRYDSKEESLWSQYTLHSSGGSDYGVYFYNVPGFTSRGKYEWITRLPTNSQKTHYGDVADAHDFDSGLVQMTVRQKMHGKDWTLEELQSDWVQAYIKSEKKVAQALEDNGFQTVADAESKMIKLNDDINLLDASENSAKIFKESIAKKVKEKYANSELITIDYDAFPENPIVAFHRDIEGPYTAINNVYDNLNITDHISAQELINDTQRLRKEITEIIYEVDITASETIDKYVDTIQKHPDIFILTPKFETNIIKQRSRIRREHLELMNIVGRIPQPPFSTNSQSVRLALVDQLTKAANSNAKTFSWADGNVHSGRWGKLRNNAKIVQIEKYAEDKNTYTVTLQNADGETYTKEVSRTQLTDAMNAKTLDEIDRAMATNTNTEYGSSEHHTELGDKTFVFKEPRLPRNGLHVQYDEVVPNIVKKLTGVEPKHLNLQSDGLFVDDADIHNVWTIELTDELKEKILSTNYQLY